MDDRRFTVRIVGEHLSVDDVRRAVIRAITDRNEEVERYGIGLVGITVEVDRA